MKQVKYLVVLPKIEESTRNAAAKLAIDLGTTVRLINIGEKKEAPSFIKKEDIYLCVDWKKDASISKALLPYRKNIITVLPLGEDGVRQLRKVQSHLPYITLPTNRSLYWASNKIRMREMFQAYNKDITPRFLVVKDDSDITINKIIKKVGLPLIMKPSGLAASLLVSKCYHEEDLRSSLKHIFKKVSIIQKEKKQEDEQIEVLVEQFMEGEMYSIDAYVSGKGNIKFCPPVHVKTGKQIGFDDFFGYQRTTPTILKASSIADAEKTAEHAIYALGLRYSTAHIELMRTEEGWKVIELGARVGGYRNSMYKLSFGIDHRYNDITIRSGKGVTVSKKINGYTACLNFYAKKEGILVKIKGIKKLKELASFVSIRKNKEVGKMCRFAKHGDTAVCSVMLFNEKRPSLLADIRRLEKAFEVVTEPVRNNVK